MKRAIIEEKSMDFAIRIVKLYRYLKEDKKERIMSKQLMRSGTSIGANVSEAQMGQTKADFYAKIAIALKEAYESYYWLRLLHATDYLSDKEFISLESDIKEILAILISISNTKKQKQNQVKN